jgi:peptidylprolyl isomerase
MRVCLLFTAAALLAVQVAACGGGAGATAPNSTAIATQYTRTAADAVERPSEVAHAGDWDLLKRFAGSRAGRLLIPNGVHPTHVVIRDLKIGRGAVLKPDHKFGVNYVNFHFTDGALIENVWKWEPLTFPWNINEIVDAWWPGLRGMRAGGVRELIAPSSWAYGDGALVYLVKLAWVET